MYLVYTLYDAKYNYISENIISLIINHHNIYIYIGGLNYNFNIL